METKYVRVPFEVELAKRIQNEKCDGKIVTRHGLSVRIICWDIKDEKFPLGALVFSNHKEAFISYTIQGGYYSDKMVEHNYDLMLEIPEYMTFKDGDVIGFINGCVGIFKSIDIDKKIFSSYATLLGFKLSFYETGWNLTGSHKATEEEKQRIIDALKESKEPKSYEYLKRFFGIEEKSKCEFKAGQPVIGVDGRGEWRYDFFTHYNPKYQNGNYICSARSYSKCLPYNEQTAHLLGTTENYE